MKINSQINMNLPNQGLQSTKKGSDNNQIKVENSDKFTPSSPEEPVFKATPKDSLKTAGAVGAAVGASIGKLALPALGVAGGLLAAAVLGPLGVGVACVLGAAAGVFAEKKTRAGNIALGMAGGAIGTGIGKAAEKMDIAPSARMANATKNFSLKSLYSKLAAPHYTSSQKITYEEAAEIKKHLKPGDIIVGNNDTTMNFEITQKIIGASGDWTHACIVKDQNTVMEVLIPEVTDRDIDSDKHRKISAKDDPDRGYIENTPENMITRNHHLMILRPQYKDDESIQNVIKVGESMKDVKYDVFFNLSSDDRMYCTEFVYKVLQKAAPEIKIEPNKFMGIKFITGDELKNSKNIDTVYNTGSDFLTNFMHKYA